MLNKLKALILGDIIGQPGCRAIFINLKSLIKEYKADLIVVNGENAADGFGITPEIANKLYESGVNVITSGNHIWQKRDIYNLLEKDERLLRPANYPKGVVGKGSTIVKIKGLNVGVVNLQGRSRMGDLDCPFSVGKKIVNQLKKDCKVIIVDFHAEDPQEKEALALHLDGEISALLGTHTHIQTGDERIFPKGTAYLTDLGMVGPFDSVIGSDKNIAINRGRTQMPLKMEIVDSPAQINGVVLEIDSDTGKAISIKRIKKTLSF